MHWVMREMIYIAEGRDSINSWRRNKKLRREIDEARGKPVDHLISWPPLSSSLWEGYKRRQYLYGLSVPVTASSASTRP